MRLLSMPLVESSIGFAIDLFELFSFSNQVLALILLLTLSYTANHGLLSIV